MNQSTIRRITIVFLSLILMLASAAPAFADGKGNGKGNGKGKGHNKIEVEVKGKGNGFGQFKGNGKFSFTLEFDDVNEEAQWAQKYIASLAAKKVFEGYTDGSFQPNKPVTRIEAVVAAVRLMGLREEAEDADLWDEDILFKDEKQIRNKHHWAVGYVLVAQEEGLFGDIDGKLQPQKAADRLWVTELLVRAMGLEDEAEDLMNAKLSFRDADEIPDDLVGYVKVALDEEIITGYTNGTFKPNKPVTRAELAAMLERTEDDLPGDDGEDSEGNDEAARGVIVREVKNNTLTLEYNGKTKVYSLDPNAFIFREGKKVSVSSLEEGDVVFIRSYNNLVIFVEVIEPAEEEAETFSRTGLFQSLTLNSRGQIRTITMTKSINNDDEIELKVSSDVTIEGDIDDLEEGRVIRVRGEDDIVDTIIIGDQSFRVEGELESITLNSKGQIASIEIRHTVRGNEQVSVYSVSSDVRIRGDLDLFEEGQDIIITGTNRTITEIVIDD